MGIAGRIKNLEGLNTKLDESDESPAQYKKRMERLIAKLFSVDTFLLSKEKAQELEALRASFVALEKERAKLELESTQLNRVEVR